MSVKTKKSMLARVVPEYFICKKHGRVTETIIVSFIGKHAKLNGTYCLICAIEKMVRGGVPRIEKAK